MAVPSSMRAVLVRDGKGPSNALYIGDTPTPRLAEAPHSTESVLVQVKAFGLNRMDLLQREGKYPPPPGASSILGVEFSGKVVDVGSEVKDMGMGEEVFGLTTGGAYAEYVCIPASMVLKKPASLSWVEAASMPEAFLTAYQALHVINELKKDEDVLIHAGASGVGVAAIQLAKVLGARHVYVTAGSQEKLDFCTSLGATDGFNYKEGSWKDKLQHATNKEGVDVIMDFIGAPYFADNLASLKRDGRLSMQGFLGGAVVKEANLGPILTKRLRIEGSTLRNRSLEYQAKLVQDFFHTGGLDKIVDGKHRLVVHAVYDWKDIAAAHDSIEANHIVATIS